MRPSRFRALSLSIALSLATLTAAHAESAPPKAAPVGGLSISPLAQTLAPSQKSGQMVISNANSKPVTLQVFVDKWTTAGPGDRELTEAEQKERCQSGKHDNQMLTPTTEIRFAPSVMTLKPGATQTVRYIMTAPEGAPEQAYRVCVKELPSPEALAQARGRVIITTSMIFPWIWRAADAKPQLSAHWSQGDLVVKNAGTATAQLVNLQAGSVSKHGLQGYVLPGETHTFKLGVKAPVGQVQTKVNGHEETLDVQ